MQLKVKTNDYVLIPDRYKTRLMIGEDGETLVGQFMLTVWVDAAQWCCSGICF